MKNEWASMKQNSKNLNNSNEIVDSDSKNTETDTRLNINNEQSVYNDEEVIFYVNFFISLFSELTILKFLSL